MTPTKPKEQLKMTPSKIEWTDRVWNPITGCTKVSQGCKNCYAEREWPRLSANPKTVYFGRAFTDVLCHHERLEQPIRWRKPSRIFVNSMSDLFHPDVPTEFLNKVWATMILSPQHTFQILTKRPERMLEYVSSIPERAHEIAQASKHILNGKSWLDGDRTYGFVEAIAEFSPVQNIWLGVSAENQETANERISLLLKTPAAIRFVSIEPMLGAISLHEYYKEEEDSCWSIWTDYLDWVICGGESGSNARPMHPSWAKSLRDQCVAAEVPFMFKQWGEWYPLYQADEADNYSKKCEMIEDESGVRLMKIGKKSAGRLLDGFLHDEYPRQP